MTKSDNQVITIAFSLERELYQVCKKMINVVIGKKPSNPSEG